MSEQYPAASASLQHVLDRWHQYMDGTAPDALDDLLHDDVVFLSPVVFTAQRGKAITKLYLFAASQALPGEPRADGVAEDDDRSGRFRYTKQIAAGNHAVLEFETTVNGKYVNGVDIISTDDHGKIVEFRVMLRPLQAVNAVHQHMAAALDALR